MNGRFKIAVIAASVLMLIAAVIVVFLPLESKGKKSEVKKEVKSKPMSQVAISVIQEEVGWELRYQQHPNGNILDTAFLNTPPDATPQQRAEIEKWNKDLLKEVVRHDPYVLDYFIVPFSKGTIKTPGYKALEDVGLRKQYWFKLAALVDAAKFEPFELNETYYNDGVEVSDGFQQTSQPTTFQGIPATRIILQDPDKVLKNNNPNLRLQNIVLNIFGIFKAKVLAAADDDDSVIIVKNNCVNIQRPAPPPKAKFLPPKKECQRVDLHAPPHSQPFLDNNPNLIKPTPGYTPGDAEKQLKSDQATNKSDWTKDSGTGISPPGNNTGETGPVVNPIAPGISKPTPTVVDPGPAKGDGDKPVDGKLPEPPSN